MNCLYNCVYSRVYAHAYVLKIKLFKCLYNFWLNNFIKSRFKQLRKQELN
jgi:hypothetical protein